MRVAPQSAPQPSQAPQQGQQGPSPQQAIQMIEAGFKALGQIIQGAGQSLPPDDIKLFQAAAQATDAMIQSLTGPDQGQQGSPQRSPGGPMPANASQGSSQSGPQGR